MKKNISTNLIKMKDSFFKRVCARKVLFVYEAVNTLENLDYIVLFLSSKFNNFKPFKDRTSCFLDSSGIGYFYLAFSKKIDIKTSKSLQISNFSESNSKTNLRSFRLIRVSSVTDTFQLFLDFKERDILGLSRCSPVIYKRYSDAKLTLFDIAEDLSSSSASIENKQSVSIFNNYLSVQDHLLNDYNIILPSASHTGKFNVFEALMTSLTNKYACYEEIIQKSSSNSSAFIQRKLEENSFLLYKQTLAMKHTMSSPLCNFLVGLFDFLLETYEPCELRSHVLSKRIESFIDWNTEQNLKKETEYFLKKKSKSETLYFQSLNSIKDQTINSELLDSIDFKRGLLKGFELSGYVKLLVFHRILSFKKESFGLLIITTLSKVLYETHSKIIEDNKESLYSLDSSEMLIVKNAEKFTYSYNFISTFLINEIIKQLVIAFKLHIFSKFISPEINPETNKLLYPISEKDQKNFDKFRVDLDSFLFEVNCEYKTSFSSSSFLDDSSIIELTPTEKAHLGNLFIVILSKLNVFTEQITPYFENKKYKTARMITLNPKFLDDFFVNQVNNSTLPSIIVPKDWQLANREAEQNSLSYGGFQINAANLTAGIHLKDEFSFSRTSDRNLMAINHLQKTGYVINEDYFAFITKNFYSALFSYCIDNEKEDSLFFNLNYSNSPKKVLFIFSEFNLWKDDFIFSGGEPMLEVVEKDLFCLNYINYKMRVSLKQDSDFNVLKSLDQLYKNTDKTVAFYAFEAGVKYDLLQSKFQTFLDIFYTAGFMNSNLKTTFFYVWFFCFRFRVYPQTGFLSLQGCCFAQSLLEQVILDPKKVLITKDSKCSYSISQLKSWENTAQKDLSKSFFHIKMKYGFSSSFCRFDVSNSGFQIFCALIGYLPGLQLTNFISPKTSLECSKLDFYGDFIENFLSGYDSFVIASTNTEQNTLEYDFLTSCKPLFTRPFLKDFLICYLYSQGDYARVLKLNAEIQKLNILTYEQKVYFKTSEKSQSLFSILRKISVYFANTFQKLHAEVFDVKIYLEKAFLKNSKASENKGLILCGGPNPEIFSKVFYSLRIDADKRISLKNAYGRPFTKKLPKKSLLFDSRKASSSISPNFIHYLDGLMNCGIIVRCEAAGIPIGTAHDAFMVNPVYESQIKRFYFETFCEIVLNKDNNPLIYFLKLNKTSFTPSEELLLNNIEKNRQKLILSIEKDFKMNYFILSP